MTARLVLALTALALVPAGSAAAQGRIAFTSAHGAGQIELVDADGAGRAGLLGQAQDPAWSPDGRMLAVARPEGEDESGIWVMAADGGGLRRLTGASGYDAEPAWGAAPPTGLLEPPVSQRIAFTRLERLENDARISVWIIESDGTGLRRASGDLYAHGPAWSPDGRRLAFTAITFTGDGATTDIHVMDADGGPSRLLVPDASSPAWSPDGRRLAFETRRDRNGESCDGDCGPASEIYATEVAAGTPTRLTFDPADDVHPSWSPDGSTIIFASDRFYPPGQSKELHAMRADGSCIVRLTAGAAIALDPAWQPGTPAGTPCEQPALTYAGIDLEPLRRYRRLPLLYLGESFRGLVPSRASVPEGRDTPRLVDLSYGDCSDPSGVCGGPVDFQLSSACDAHPLSYSGTPDSRAVMRGALVERWGEAVNVYSGGLSMRIYTGGLRGPSPAALRRIVAALQPPSGPARLGRRLSPPVFPASVLGRVREIEMTLRRHGLEKARRRLRLSRSAIRDRVRLARTLRSLPRPTARQRRAARCRPDPLLP